MWLSVCFFGCKPFLVSLHVAAQPLFAFALFLGASGSHLLSLILKIVVSHCISCQLSVISCQLPVVSLQFCRAPHLLSSHKGAVTQPRSARDRMEPNLAHDDFAARVTKWRAVPIGSKTHRNPEGQAKRSNHEVLGEMVQHESRSGVRCR